MRAVIAKEGLVFSLTDLAAVPRHLAHPDPSVSQPPYLIQHPRTDRRKTLDRESATVPWPDETVA